MDYKLYLDDVRACPIGWTLARSYDEAVSIVLKSFPCEISFDHDLGEEKTGYDFASWLIELDMDAELMPNGFKFSVHSANPIGKLKIESLMNNYLKFKEK